MRPVHFPAFAGGLALTAAAMVAGTAWAGPEADRGGSDAAAGVCRNDAPAARDRPACPADAGLIDALPDSFFVGGGGVGPQAVDDRRQASVWVYVAGSAAASAHAQARATARVGVVVRPRP